MGAQDGSVFMSGVRGGAVRARRWMAICAATAVVSCAAGCGGSSTSSQGKTETEKWADDVCSSISTWRDTVSQAKSTLRHPADLTVSTFEDTGAAAWTPRGRSSPRWETWVAGHDCRQPGRGPDLEPVGAAGQGEGCPEEDHPVGCSLALGGARQPVDNHRGSGHHGLRHQQDGGRPRLSRRGRRAAGRVRQLRKLPEAHGKRVADLTCGSGQPSRTSAAVEQGSPAGDEAPSLGSRERA